MTGQKTQNQTQTQKTQAFSKADAPKVILRGRNGEWYVREQKGFYTLVIQPKVRGPTEILREAYEHVAKLAQEKNAFVTWWYGRSVKIMVAPSGRILIAPAKKAMAAESVANAVYLLIKAGLISHSAEDKFEEAVDEFTNNVPEDSQ